MYNCCRFVSLSLLCLSLGLIAVLLCTQVRCTQLYAAPPCTWIPSPMKGFPEGFRMVECIVNDSSSTQALCRQHQSNIEQQLNAIVTAKSVFKTPPAPTAHVQPNTATLTATTPSCIHWQMLRMKINGSYQMERERKTKELMIHH